MILAHDHAWTCPLPPRFPISAIIAFNLPRNRLRTDPPGAIHIPAQRTPPSRKNSSTGAVCRSYALQPLRTTSSRSSSRTTSFDAVVIANFRNRRRVRRHTVQRATDRTLPPSGKSRHNNIIVDFQVDHHGRRIPCDRQQLAARIFAWLTVRGYPSRIKPGLQSGCSIRSSTSSIHGLIRHQTRRPAESISTSQPQVVPPRHPLPQHVAGRNMRQLQAIASAASLASPCPNPGHRTGSGTAWLIYR